MEHLFCPHGRYKRWQYLSVNFAVVGLVFAVFTFIHSQYDPTDPPWLTTRIILGSILGTFTLFATWTIICATSKRFHDLGLSGWWSAIIFIPALGPIMLLIICGGIAGQKNNNWYGRDPSAALTDDLLKLTDYRFHGLRPIAVEAAETPPIIPPYRMPAAPLFGMDSKFERHRIQ